MVLICVNVLQFVLVLLFKRKSLIWDAALGLHGLVDVNVTVGITLAEAQH